jgi:uncharacterized membrane protein YhaH (DUF805 family)
MIAGMAIAIPVMVRMMTNLQQYIATHPHGLPPPAPGQLAGLPPGLMPDFSVMAVPMAVTNIVLVLLLAAAVVRRLHDRDRTGLWALMPLPFMIIGMINTKAAFAIGSGERRIGAQDTLMFASSPLFWLSLIVLIVLLAGKGTSGPNRFGPDPAAPA